MAILADSNTLIRTLDSASRAHASCRRLLERHRDGEIELRVCAQVLIEFWVVITRPSSANGLGLTTKNAGRLIDEFLKLIPLLPEPQDLFERWHALVARTGTSGKAAHDARIAALMHAHDLTEIVTLNPTDFRRYDLSVFTPESLT